MAYKKCVISGILLLVTCFSIWSQQIGEKKVKLLWEKKIDILSEKKTTDQIITIRDDEVYFAETEVTVEEARKLGLNISKNEIPNGKVLIPYPKVIITNNKIVFLSTKNEITKEYPLKNHCEVGFSNNKRYIGVMEVQQDLKKRGFILLNSDGDVMWNTDISRVGYTLPYISPNGEYIIATGDPTGDFCDYYPSIWTKNGIKTGLLQERENFELKHLDFTEDGDHIAIVFEGAEAETTNIMTKTNTGEEAPYVKMQRYSIIKMMYKQGKEIWRKKEKGYPRGIAISSNNKFVAVAIKSTKGSKSNSLILYDVDSKKLWEKSIYMGNVKMLFSEDEKILAVITGWGAFYCFETSSGRLVGDYYRHTNMNFNNPEYVYRKISADSDSKTFMLTGFVPNYASKEIEREDFIDFVNEEGKLLTTLSFPKNKLFGEKKTPNIQFNNNQIVGLFRQSSSLVFYLIQKYEEEE